MWFMKKKMCTRAQLTQKINTDIQPRIFYFFFLSVFHNRTFFEGALQPKCTSGRLDFAISRSHIIWKAHPVGLLWTKTSPSNRPVITQHTTMTRLKHSCPQRDSNPRSQPSSGHRPMPQTAGTPRLAYRKHPVLWSQLDSSYKEKSHD